MSNKQKHPCYLRFFPKRISIPNAAIPTSPVKKIPSHRAGLPLSPVGGSGRGVGLGVGDGVGDGVGVGAGVGVGVVVGVGDGVGVGSVFFTEKVPSAVPSL